MKTFLALVAITWSVCTAQASQKSDFNVERLSPKGRAAYRKLLTTEIFRVGGIGYSGGTSEEELALYDTLEERDAIEALHSLVSDGSYEGGLYGLLGLSITDAAEFKRAVAVYKSRGQPLERHMPQFFSGLDIPKGNVLIQAGCTVMTDGWLKVVNNIQTNRYDKKLRRKRG